MNTRLYLFFLICVAPWWHVCAQSTWRIAYGAYGPEEGRCVKVAYDGNYVIAGSTGSFGSGASDIYMLKLDGNGVLLWSRTIGGPMIEQASDLVQLSDGGWLVIGSTNGAGGAGGYDGLLVRTDPEGSVLWQREYGGSDWDFFHSGILLDDGGYLLVGQTFSQGIGGDAWLVRTDSSGDTLWTRHYGGSGLDDGQAVVSTIDGGLVFAGSSSSASSDLDAYVVRLDDQLAIQWDNTYGGDSLDVARDIVSTQDGGFSVVGVTKSFSEFTEHYHFKLNSAGDLQWQKNWGQVEDQEAFRHVELPSGGFATTGWTKTSGGGGKDMFIFLCDAQGEFIAQHTFGGGEDDMGYSLAETADGFVACGATLSYGAGSNDVFVVRTDSAGNTASEVVTTFFDPLSVDPIPVAAEFLSYPNPSQGIVHLPFAAKYVMVEIFDAQGRSLQHWKEPAEMIDLSGMANGFLFLRATDRDGNIMTAPLILNKP